MALFDQIIGMATQMMGNQGQQAGGQQAGANPMMAILAQLLASGGQSQSGAGQMGAGQMGTGQMGAGGMMGQISQMMQGFGMPGQAAAPAPSPAASPLAGLLAQFQQAGLGDVAGSWVGTGQNKPVAPDQLMGVFGAPQVQQWAGQTGMEPNALLGILSSMLPQAVDRMTPQGQVPDETQVATGLPQILAGLFSGRR